MRKNPLLPLALACGALLLGAGPALAAASASPSAATSSAAPTPTRSGAAGVSQPTAAPSRSASGSGQVRAVPVGAPDTGVPVTGGGNDTATVGATAAGVAALGAVGAVVLRRRSKVRG
jgi:LPXTG-motif cell wall-anchored protein